MKTSATMKSSNVSTSFLNREASDDIQKESVIFRPTRHVDNQCYCYSNRSDCTTCSTLCTDDSDVFVLTSSESRSAAGSSSEDGSSLEINDLREKVSDSELNASQVSSESSEVSDLEPRDFDKLLQILDKKANEFEEVFRDDSESFGKLMTMHGFQRAVIDDELKKIVSNFTDETLELIDKSENFEGEFPELDFTEMLKENCVKKHAKLRELYLTRLMDEDLMKSNVIMIQETKERLERFNQLLVSKCSESSEFSELDMDKILDDVSTACSFCK
ncbi:hypothetical protein GCK72_019037 [Caenorhabditis remanei]|uniref:Uncharacterized protein n=1 Tax=Caenorhabditis remanei TaxID=31234 RepID=A0A6A5GDE6_CAERE|nr:hypothetical protein GCK72_019037 [Caenorhabditis remanei]KAF1752482.1 hypothetical protein GCK72_019037 [Caenorhabditis remanei]